MDKINSNQAEAIIPKPESRFDRIPHILMLLLAFVLPIFTLPSSIFSLGFEKKLLVVFVALVAFTLWIIGRLASGTLNFTIGRAEKLFIVVYVLMLISALFSSVRAVSLSGLGPETGSLLSLFAFGILLFLATRYFGQLEKAFFLFIAIASAIAIVFIVQAISLFADLSFLGISGTQYTLVGRWTDLGILFGLGLVLSALSIKLISKAGYMRIGTWSLFVISLAGAIVTNFTTAWWVTLVLSIIFLVYEIFLAKGISKSQAVLLLPVFIIIIASTILLVWGRDNGAVDKYIEAIAPTPLEVRPSWQGTFAIARETLKTDPLFGSGPNRFSSEWQKYKPTQVNQSLFWGVDFDAGVGFIPTFLVTTGFAGFIAWLAFVALLVLFVLRSLFMATKDVIHKSLTIISGFATLYLWAIMFIYIPSTVSVALTFIITGVFIALYNKAGANEEVEPARTPTRSLAFNFASVLVLILLLLTNIISFYTSVEQARAWHAYGNGLKATQVDGNLDKGIAFLEKSIKIRKNDIYFRALTELRLVKISTMLSQADVPKDALESLRSTFIDLYGVTLRDAETTVTSVDPSNYLNWLSLAHVYSEVVPLGLANAADPARLAFDQAIKRAPTNPRPYTEAARFEFVTGNNENGQKLLDYALALKPNHAGALIIRAQLAIQNGDLDKALIDTRDAVIANPNDIGALFQLGYLTFQAGKYEDTKLALERAVSLNPYYADAKYYLGLAYYELGEIANARDQFQGVLELNPDNEHVLLILSNLRAGRSPLSGLRGASSDVGQ